MPDFITNCAIEPYDQFPGLMNDIYPQADFCVFNAGNFNHLFIGDWTIKIGGIEHNDNPPYCGANGTCGFWEWESPGENCTPQINHFDCTQGYGFIGGYCDADFDGELDPYMYPDGDYGACDQDGDGIAEINNNVCYPNACQIALDCTHSNNCRCMEQNGTCDAVAFLYQGTVVAMEYVNTMLAGGMPVNGIAITIAMYDSNFTYAFNYIGYPRAGAYIDDVIFYRASTGTHHSLTNESYEHIFNQAQFMNWNGQIYNGLANDPTGLQLQGGMVYTLESLTLEFEESDTQQTTDIIYELHSGANLISIPLAAESWNNALNDVPLPDTVVAISSEGIAAMRVDEYGWAGSLIEFEPHKGYWFMTTNTTIFQLSGIMMDSNYLYQLHQFHNLISFPNEVSMPIQNVFSDDVLPYIYMVSGEGVAAMQTSPGFWVGSLQNLQPFTGYWVTTTQSVNFTFGNVASSGLSNRIKRTFLERDVNIPPIDDNGNYQNPHTGIYDWSISNVVEYIKLQLTGTIVKDNILNTNKKRVEKLIKTKKSNRSIRRNFGK